MAEAKILVAKRKAAPTTKFQQVVENPEAENNKTCIGWGGYKVL